MHFVKDVADWEHMYVADKCFRRARKLQPVAGSKAVEGGFDVGKCSGKYSMTDGLLNKSASSERLGELVSKKEREKNHNGTAL
ncbi:unnamed protein product [Nippostrongylus brasiliensis]|uniref:SPX domain-containing protein n=1 Tax=Nippostrongylus brasiliensis TaxID=27835 RepID=A0A0N4XYL2_NIPBR|nr:hypothetical protein Q1695_009560 [Nippostrongylus brasiliensis]VDL71771.1 unnamed protein product [Nippostrongylus brasiliensis]